MSAFSAGVFYIKNSPAMKQLFEATNKHIKEYMNTIKRAPICLDQPFLVYNSFIQEKYDNQLMKKYLQNNPPTVNLDMVIYHFPGGPGNYSSKQEKMTNFFEKMRDAHIDNSIKMFDTRNEMIKYYCNKLVNPKILEICVFKGDFLNFIITNCNVGSIDAVDLFEGVTCSGDADGNNVINYDVGRSYNELCERYKDTSSIRLHKMRSDIFLSLQEDNTYDIIYIDGDHSYEGVKSDLLSAYNKIKNGGYIMGHDYEMNMIKARISYDFGVKKAVDEFCITYNQTIIAKGNDGCISFCIKVNK
jgi:hypothetical protein